jgi:energy-coupling factor transporter ATP-binding protein EcfA2
MQLTAFRIFKYRNIEDSGLVKLSDRLTCIVGKNQSGKTNLLRALQKLNPHDQSIKYDVRSDWPRGRRRNKDENHVVCEAHFDLDVERNQLSALADSAVEITKVVITKNYAGQYTVEFPEDPDFFANRVQQNDMDQIIAKLAVPSMPVGEAFFRTSEECIAEVKQTALHGQVGELPVLVGPHREKLQNVASSDQTQRRNEAEFLVGYLNLLAQISTELAALPTMRTKAHEYIVTHLPTFIYMDEHRSFEGTAHLDQVLQRIKLPTPQDETLTMIFKLAGLDLGKLVERQFTRSWCHS